MYIGFHISVEKKKFKNRIEEAVNNYQISAIQFFLKSPRQKTISNISSVEVDSCRKYVKDKNIKIFVHSTYLMNIASKDDYEYKINTALDDLNNIYLMGGIGAVFHVGKYLKMDKSIALNNMKEFIIDILSQINNEQKFILETAAGCGTELCFNLEEFGKFFNSFEDEQKTKMGVCIDTCHVFSAGYNLKTVENVNKFIELVEEHINWKNVVLIHLNDSMKDCGCRVDRHQNLCNGFISSESSDGLKYLVNYCIKEHSIPIVLETPILKNSRKIEIDMIKEWIN